MFKAPISIAFAPNFEPDDVALCWRLLRGQHDKTTIDNSIGGLKNWFREHTGHKYAFCFSSGRAGLYFLLKSLDLKPEEEVLTQAFTCVAVPNSIIWSGLRPVYVDVDKSSYNLDVVDVKKKLSARTRAIIIQHTFGIPGPIDATLKLAKENNLVVIEDCAHALGAKHKNKNVGSYGDVSFFSLGRDKVVSSVFGGVVTTNNSKIAQRLELFETGLTPPPKEFVAKQLLYPILYAISLPLYPILFGLLFVRVASLLKVLTPAVLSEEKEAQRPVMISYSFSPLLALLAMNQLRKLSRFNNHRVGLAKVYQQGLGGLPLASGATYLRFPHVVKNKKRALDKAKKMGVYLGDWYDNAVYPANNPADFLYEPGVCPTAEKLAKTTINLPTHINTSPQDALRVVDQIKNT